MVNCKSKQYSYWNRCWCHEYIFAYLVLPRFDTVYQPHQNLCIDEGMVLWRGNLDFRTVQISQTGMGFKLTYFVMRNMGIVWKWSCTQGNFQYPQCQRWDLRLLRNHYACGHILYCDNYYSSPQLFMDLWCLGVGATGTVRPNRRGILQMIKEVSKLVIVALYFPIRHKLICSKTFI